MIGFPALHHILRHFLASATPAYQKIENWFSDLIVRATYKATAKLLSECGLWVEKDCPCFALRDRTTPLDWIVCIKISSSCLKTVQTKNIDESIFLKSASKLFSYLRQTLQKGGQEFGTESCVSRRRAIIPELSFLYFYINPFLRIFSPSYPHSLDTALVKWYFSCFIDLRKNFSYRTFRVFIRIHYQIEVSSVRGFEITIFIIHIGLAASWKL